MEIFQILIPFIDFLYVISVSTFYFGSLEYRILYNYFLDFVYWKNSSESTNKVKNTVTGSQKFFSGWQFTKFSGNIEMASLPVNSSYCL